jgi:ABC-type uncharacterized transport system substrate-binding protein
VQDKRDVWHKIPMQQPPYSPNFYTEHCARGYSTRSDTGWWIVLLLCCLCTAQPTWAAKCLFISSYHQGYAWSDGVERGLRPVLQGHCELKQFDMDAKRHKEPAEVAQKALEAKALIEVWRPDVVITADDDAAQYLIMPFYKDHTIPFVFCGINWTIEEYGFPYRNITGMVEVAPIEPLFDQAKALLPAYRRAFYLGANTSTERKNLERFQAVATRRGVQLDSSLVDTTEAWLAAFHRAQQYDFMALGSHSGINDWQDTTVLADIGKSGRPLTLTNHEWMMPFAMLGLTKVPEEQGEWAAKIALQILHGVAPSSIPIVPNRKWDIWMNPVLVETAGITLPKPLMQKAKKVN